MELFMLLKVITMMTYSCICWKTALQLSMNVSCTLRRATSAYVSCHSSDRLLPVAAWKTLVQVFLRVPFFSGNFTPPLLHIHSFIWGGGGLPEGLLDLISLCTQLHYNIYHTWSTEFHSIFVQKFDILSPRCKLILNTFDTENTGNLFYSVCNNWRTRSILSCSGKTFISTPTCKSPRDIKSLFFLLI